jgi:hypothetical protein
MDHVHITDALRELVFEPAPGDDVDAVLDRYYSADYTHRSDGQLMDRSAFAAMVTASRARITRGSAVVIDELVDGHTYAERHRFHVEFADGTSADREVAVFGTIGADGRFEHLSEVGFTLPGADGAR